MAKYFETFPNRLYDINGDGNQKLVKDIFRRMKVRDGIKNNLSLMATYDVMNGDTPETIAYKHFGSTDYFWVILISNDVTDRYYGWPLSESDFETYVKDKYAEPDGVHHYEVTQSSGNTTGDGPFDYSHKVEVNSDAVGAQSVSNRQFEEREQDKLRNIKLIDPKFLPLFIEEFERLVTR